MQKNYGVFNTDGMNLQNTFLPLAVLTEGVVDHVTRCSSAGCPLGVPANIGHDMCRPIGWSIGNSILLAKDRARQLGVMLFPTSDEERAQMECVIDAFWHRHHTEGVNEYKSDLLERIEPHSADNIAFFRLEAVAARGELLAAKLYPQFFDMSSENVDKDGLLDYAALLAETSQVLPGVYYDSNKKLVLFAHQYYRRSLSVRNSLNFYVLDRFHKFATSSGRVSSRIRLDPNLIGHPESVRPQIELEYWYGPHFNDDISSIKTGVAEHKADEATRLYQGIDKTQIWWKDEEERHAEKTRTFEIEELVDNPSFGIGADYFGCRYAHAEYDVDKNNIKHFDGAIRMYQGESYFERIGRAISKAGKRSDYTKLFRLDGDISVREWKELLTDFYRGNCLVPEYLGMLKNVEHSQDNSTSNIKSDVPKLSALINFDVPPDNFAPNSTQCLVYEVMEIGGKEILTAEVGGGPIEALFDNWIKANNVCKVNSKDSVKNLPTIILGNSPSLSAQWAEVATNLSKAIYDEYSLDEITFLSVAVAWKYDAIMVQISISGAAEMVAALLLDASRIVHPERAAADWIEDLNEALKKIAPELLAPVACPQSAINRGRLVVDREESFDVEIVIPPSLMSEFGALVSGETT